MGPESDNLKWHVLRHIADSVRCSVCQRSFTPDEVVILSRQEDLWFVSVSCDTCGTESTILVILQSHTSDPATSSDDDPDSVSVVSSTSTLRQSRSRLGPITATEIESLHHFLQGYHGNLSEFWRTDDE